MRSTSSRRLVALIAAVCAFGIVGASSASAAAMMPAGNPIDYASLSKTATAQVFNVTIKGTQLEGDAMTKTVTNGLMGGMGATVTVNKAVDKGMTMVQTITVKPTKVGEVTSSITNAFATLSGGNYGSGVISGTSLKNDGSSYTIKMWFDEQGANPNLNLRFYLYHS
ncbi:MAG: hypothetical protein ACR2JV_05505 [Gaiellales bacterium]